MDSKYLKTFDDFLKEHPEIDPSWQPFIEPAIQTVEDQIFAFIMGYIFM
jgi:hypothetical protein